MTEVQHTFVCGRWQDNLPPEGTSFMLADPLYGTDNVRELAKLAVESKIPSCIFMWPDDVWGLPYKPDQLLHWVKPISTKNTVKRYSSFVEVIVCYGVTFHRLDLHWSNRTGLFNDQLITKEHEWKKPEPLIERLLLNHYPKHGIVYDPCAGSRTVEKVCKKLGIPSHSVDDGKKPNLDVELKKKDMEENLFSEKS